MEEISFWIQEQVKFFSYNPLINPYKRMSNELDVMMLTIPIKSSAHLVYPKNDKSNQIE